MVTLPLFPLHTVLFPGMPLMLHIFEDRYKTMMRECIADEKPFGVVLIAEGAEAGAVGAQPHDVGCTARITQVERLPGGRMNIVAIGETRFRIDSLNRERAYLAGDVTPMPLEVGDQSIVDRTLSQLGPMVERYLAILAELSDTERERQSLPQDPAALGFLAAMLLQVTPEQKQPLLAAEETEDLLAEVFQLYRWELPLLEVMAVTARRESDSQSFSLN